MPEHQSKSARGLFGRRARPWLLRACLCAALLLSVYLAWSSMLTEFTAGCVSSTAACDEVLQSRWSRWFGIPIALPASSVYLTALVLTAFIADWVPARPRRFAWLLLNLIAAAILVSVCWFVGIQALLLRAFCPLCMATHICGAAAAFVICWDAPVSPRMKLAAWSVGLVAGVLLVPLAQILGSSPNYELERVVDRHGITPFRFEAVGMSGIFATKPEVIEEGGADEPDTGEADTDEADAGEADAGEADAGKNAVGRGRARLLDGLLVIDPSTHPRLGPADGNEVVVMLFDYKCGHCRRLDRYLSEISRRRERPLTIIPLVTPLDANCNPHVSDADRNGASCELARLSLAVWKAEPAAFAEYHAWLLEGPRPRSVLQAKEHAERLVGVGRLNRILSDGSIDERLGRQTELYGYVGAGATPKLLLPNAILTGTPDSAAVLEQLLDQEL